MPSAPEEAFCGGGGAAEEVVPSAALLPPSPAPRRIRICGSGRLRQRAGEPAGTAVTVEGESREGWRGRRAGSRGGRREMG